MYTLGSQRVYINGIRKIRSFASKGVICDGSSDVLQYVGWDVRVSYSEWNTQNNTAIARYTIQWIIFSANLWTPTSQTTSGCKDSKSNGTKPNNHIRRKNLTGKPTLPLQRTEENR